MTTLMCENCFKKYWRVKYFLCKVCGKNLVNIDENFIEAIILLNKKGYLTDFCCSGHPDRNKNGSAYISFKKNGILPYLPSDWIYDKDRFSDCGGDNGYTIRVSFKNEGSTGLQKEILKNAIKILDWATSLPYRNDK